MITLEQVKADPSIKTYIRMADASLGELGFTEHSFAHVGKTGGRGRIYTFNLRIRQAGDRACADSRLHARHRQRYKPALTTRRAAR